MRPELAGDTATLAAAEAGPDGDAEKAVAAILKHHPEWKAVEESSKKKAAGGFQLGADPDRAAAKSAGKPGETAGKKRWNRFK